MTDNNATPANNNSQPKDIIDVLRNCARELAVARYTLSQNADFDLHPTLAEKDALEFLNRHDAGEL
jgi:hypothetical protein